MCLLLFSFFFLPSGFSCYGDERRGEVESQGKEESVCVLNVCVCLQSSISLSENNYACSSSHLQVSRSCRSETVALHFSFLFSYTPYVVMILKNNLCLGVKLPTYPMAVKVK